MKMMKIMKKNYIKIMAAAALVLVSACSQEIEIGGGEYGDNTIVFTMGTPSTRSAVALADYAKQGATIPLGTDEAGTSFILEESVIDLNAPITRGTPAYTENVGALYGSFAAKSELSGTGVDEFAYDSGKWTNTYDESIWTGRSKLNFYMYMPMDMTVAPEGGTAPVSNLNFEDQKITFKYTSPANAADQDDILFSYKELKKSEYNPKEGASILFHHALTGVKFRLENPDVITSINSVTFNNIVTEGSCTVTPKDEKEVDPGVDNPTGHYSSGDGATVVWDLGEEDEEVRGNVSSGDFGDLVTYGSGKGEVANFGAKGTYPESFAKKGNDNNLNDAQASQTFWLIPQPITADVQLTISYTDAAGKDHDWTVDFGTAVGSVVWKAGQIRTYTIKVDEVNVMIKDGVTITGPVDVDVPDATDGQKLHSYAGSTKQSVEIKNTGNTDVYIRAALIGQWLDEESGDPVFGYTDFTSGNFKTVDSWYQDQFGPNAQYNQGKFEGLVGYDDSYSGNWTKGTDGYYYYNNPVAPGKIIGGTAGTGDYLGDPLFAKYTVRTAPASAVAGHVKQIYFQLEIATQAIAAKKNDGTYYTMEEAWAKANTPDPQLP